MRTGALLAIAAMLAMVSAPAFAAFHLWKIDQVYTNADHSVQFIRMWNGFNGEQFVAGMEVRSLATGKTFTFPHNLPSSATANRHILLATPGFSDMPGSVPPDFVLQAEFFASAGDTITLVASGSPLNSITVISFPIDGYHAYFRHQGIGQIEVRLNQPINFAGETGSLPIPGDANLDGRVDGEDFLIWQAGFGTQSGATWTDGDFNFDGRVDGEDFLIWQANFGSTTGSSAMTPEPGALVLLPGVAGLLLRRRQ